MIPSPDFLDDLPDLSQRLRRVASLKHILAANIPCALWGKEALVWHSVPDFWHDTNVLVPDAQLTAAAAALASSGEFTMRRPARRVGVNSCYDAESMLPGPCVRLFTTTPPPSNVNRHTMPLDTPCVEILLIPASNYSVDLVKQAHLFNAYQIPGQLRTSSETLRPSLLVPKNTTLIAGIAAFLLSKSPYSLSGPSLDYHASCLLIYQYYSERRDPFYPDWSPNTKEEAMDLRHTLLAQLGTGTDAHWLYKLLIEAEPGPEPSHFFKRLEETGRQLENTEQQLDIVKIPNTVDVEKIMPQDQGTCSVKSNSQSHKANTLWSSTGKLPPDLSQRLNRVASLRHILAANIPCAIWGREAFMWQTMVYTRHEAHVLVPDAQLAAAAAALTSSGEFTASRPAHRVGVNSCEDTELILPGPCVRLFTTTPPVLPCEDYHLPTDTPSLEILLIPASTYSVDLVNAHLFDAYQIPDQVQNDKDIVAPAVLPSLLVPKLTTLFDGIAAFLVSNSPHSHSFEYHTRLLGNYHFSSEYWDVLSRDRLPNSEKEALEGRRTLLAQLGTDARWIYEFLIETGGCLKGIDFAKRLESKRAENKRTVKLEDHWQGLCSPKSNALQSSQIRGISTKSHLTSFISGHPLVSAPRSNMLDARHQLQTSNALPPSHTRVRSSRRVFRRFPSTVPGLRRK